MNIYQQIEEEEKLLEESVADGAEEEIEAEAEEAPEELADEAVEEPKEPQEETPKDAHAYVRLRHEKREAERKAKELQDELERLKSAKTEPVKDHDPQPDRETEYEAWLEWNNRQLQARVSTLESTWQKQSEQQQIATQWQQAVNEFQRAEDSFKARTPDYDEVAAHYKDKMYQLAVLENPTATDQQINQIVANKIMMTASKFAQLDLDPAEQLYKLTKEKLDYKPKPAAKPDLKKIASTQRKTASPLAGGSGAGKQHLSLEAAANMSIAELSRLTPQQLAELENYGM